MKYTIISTIMLVSSILFTLGCTINENPCDALICLNDGICNDGNCDCAIGYEGDICEEELRAKYIGKYNYVSTECNYTLPSGTEPLQVIQIFTHDEGILSLSLSTVQDIIAIQLEEPNYDRFSKVHPTYSNATLSGVFENNLLTLTNSINYDGEVETCTSVYSKQQ